MKIKKTLIKTIKWCFGFRVCTIQVSKNKNKNKLSSQTQIFDVGSIFFVLQTRKRVLKQIAKYILKMRQHIP